MKRERPEDQRRGGWLLIEVLLMLVMMSAFLLVESRLFVGVVRAWSATRQAETQVAQFDHAMAVLRGDVWGATGVTVEGETRLVLSGAGGGVAWSADEALARESGGERRSWSDPGQTLRFAFRGPRVLVTARSATGEETELAFVSQVLLAEATR